MSKRKILTMNELLTRSDIFQTLEMVEDAARDANGLVVIIWGKEDNRLNYVTTMDNAATIAALERIKTRIIVEEETENEKR